jgi:formamidopyrimidine-DNA glycosylase
MDFNNGMTLVFHLKMTGQFLISLSHEPQDKHTHFTLAFRNQMEELRFRDVRKFGSLLCFQTPQTLKFDGLGPEPLEISFPRFRSLFQGRKARLKGLLLNQNFIAGIGNIYADEILFEAKLHPLTSVSVLEEEDYMELWEAMRLVLRRALKHKGTSIRDFKDAEGREGDFQNYLQVYGRESLPCLRCGEIIERLRLNGRSSHFCPRCQKEKRGNP